MCSGDSVRSTCVYLHFWTQPTLHLECCVRSPSFEGRQMEETCAPYNTEIWCSQGIHSFQILAQTANSGATALLKHKAWWPKKISQKERSSNRSAKSGDKDFVLILKLLECNRMHDIFPRMKKTKTWSCFLLQQTKSCRYCILMWPHLSCFCIHPSTPVYPEDNPVPKIAPTRKTLCRSVILAHMKVSFPPPYLLVPHPPPPFMFSFDYLLCMFSLTSVSASLSQP